jgi:stage III sporulation protein AA
VIDERGELFPVSGGFSTGKRTDILSGCRKPQGIETAMRTMGPSWIAVDEVTASADCDAMIQACWCGVRLIATAHASSKEDLLHRSVYRPLVQSGIFDTLVILQRDKSWKMERMK